MIRIENLYKEWRDFSLKDINLEIKKGEYFVLLGPTGAGKTLLLEMIAGFYTPERGRIWIDGRDVTYLPPEKRRIGFIYQDYSLFPHLTVRQNVEFGLKPSNPERSKEIMERLGISHLADRYPKTLSGGEQQKVAIARAIAINPSLLLLDEPLSSLDPRTKDYLRGELKRIKQEFGITMVHVTHDHAEAILLADRIAVMMDGRIAQVGETDEIFSMPCSVKLANFVGVSNIFKGRIQKYENGIAEVMIDGRYPFTISVVSSLSNGDVMVMIRPEEIVLSKDVKMGSARNVVHTRIESIDRGSPVVYVKTDSGLTAVITELSRKELMLQTGDEINAIFKANSVHLLRDGDG